MNKNIIYSCYNCPKDKEPKFLDLHLNLVKLYADRISCDFKVIANVPKQYNPPVFTVYEAYKEFADSNYDKMLYIDWDVLISLNSPSIFDEYENEGSLVQTIRLEEFFDGGWKDYEKYISDHRPVGLSLKFNP